MTLRLVAGVAALLLAACGHRPPLLPDRGIDIDVRVHVGSAAVQRGTLTPAEPTHCGCCTGAGCTCRRDTDR